MQQNPPPQPPFPDPTIPVNDDPTTSAPLFDWSDFLEFNLLDETLTIPFPPTDQQPDNQSQPDENNNNNNNNSNNRVRKRDPKLVCPNFLAGRIPCACPEMDAMLAEEEEKKALLKKRTRTAKTSTTTSATTTTQGSGPAQGRCQVSGCEADISELKGYHKRHRVCLRCANATSVLINGESMRYCQQCGKFHLLSDFDEGKRSCRRKLERHNNRRRRKPNVSKRGMGKKEDQQSILTDDVSGDDGAGKGILDDVSGDDEAGKDVLFPSSQNEESEISLVFDRHVSTLSSAPLSTENLQSNSIASFAASGEVHTIDEKQNSQYNRSSSYSENKNTFSSTCPSGRVSFKLYDWNPAEFPRRLRHQIFEWLANMPIELEGYIRPGCTILTAFIAMPKSMWLKLLEEPASCIKDLVASPGSVLSGRDTMLVYLNDMMFRVSKDATSIMKIKMKDRAPKLHYVYPTCFEAGRPMEFIACGSNLLQPHFRLLVSFAGKYLAYNIFVSSVCCKKEGTNDFDHQLLKICIPQTDLDLFGAAFIEVEHESGLSNFIPILIGDKETCAEMEILQRKCETHEKLPSCPRPECEVFALRQANLSEFILDVAWSLKPVSRKQWTTSHVQRYNSLLAFLIEKDSSVILERIVCSLISEMHDNLVAGVAVDDMTLLQKNMAIAQTMLDQKSKEKDYKATFADENICSKSSQHDDRSVIAATSKGMQKTLKNMLGAQVFPPSPCEIVPLLNNEVIMNVAVQERPQKLSSCQRSLTSTVLTSRTLLIAISTICVCFGVCAVAIHPQRVTQIATTIRRCLFDSP